MLQQRFINIAHGRRAGAPHDFHNLQLLRGEDRFPGQHTKTLVLDEADVNSFLERRGLKLEKKLPAKKTKTEEPQQHQGHTKPSPPTRSPQPSKDGT